MNESQLRAFHAVATSGSFTAAAKRLHVSQPAITQHVKTLEESYDTELFVRTRQGARLTQLGLSLLEVTSQIYELEKNAQNLLEEAGTELRGVLRIAADGPFHSIEILRRFRNLHPKVQVILEVGNSTAIEARLRSHQADVGVLADFKSSDGMVGCSLGSAEIGLFVGAKHPWSKRKNLALRELDEVELLRREVGSRTRLAFEKKCEAFGVVPTYTMEFGSREALREAVAAGLGIGVVNFAEIGRDPRVVAISNSDAEIMSEEFVITLVSRRTSRLVDAFFKVVEEDALPH